MAFTEIRWKFVIAITAVSIVISLAGGIIGSVEIETILLRTLLGAIVFLGIAILLNTIYWRVFPDFLTEDLGESESIAAGSYVDLLAGDEIKVPVGDNNGEMGEDTGEDVTVDHPETVHGQEILQSEETLKNTPTKEWEQMNNSDRVERLIGSHYEPGRIAQAIQTVLKQDEKG